MADLHAPAATAMTPDRAASSIQMMSVELLINRTRTELEMAPWTTLLDVLRDRLQLTGMKEGCDLPITLDKLT